MKALTKFVVFAGLFATTINTLPSYAATNPLKDAINHPARSAVNKARDVHRHPYETLSFFDVKADSTVVEISPGGGWYSEILAPLLKEKGKYYAAHQPADATSDYAKRTRAAYLEKLAADPVYKAVTVTGFAPDKMYEVAPAGSADVVLTFRNLHNWYEKDKGEASLLTAFKTFHAALKPGGVLGVVEHRLPESKLKTDWTDSGYMPQSMVVKVAEQAGFVLDGTSEVNANPKDTADHPKGVWTLPPVLALKDQDKAKYIAIGESDRMTLKFRKPKAE
ncbi:class I SAM-dependent methyltransferase [Rheinheimera sp.]|uniref:class I SAM-dependent methyltransferase n=1 Tax=Rheinheimera sp. TaxID=1869214 RepID=UPI0027BADBBB|nr:methyltransferase [Rheinheimera sp.]